MLPICSFNIKAKIPHLQRIVPNPKTLGDHLRKVRLERNLSQQKTAKLFGINGMYLSSWELNRKQTHPKHLEAIIQFLGYTPKLTSTFDRLGARTKLWRIVHNISMDGFSEMIAIQKKKFKK